MDFVYDNDWGLTIIVCVFCTAINLTLPIWLCLAKFCDERKSRRNEMLAVSNIPVDESDDDDDDGGDNDDNKNDRKFDLMQRSNSSVVSDAEYSTVSSTLSISSQLATNFLEARPRSYPKRRKRERDIRFAAEISKLNFEEESSYGMAYPFSVTGTVSGGAKSVMSKLSVDDVSMKDGVNEMEDQQSDANSTMNIVSYEKSSWWEKLLEVTDWDTEHQRLCSLAGFYTVQEFTDKISALVELAVISHMIGIPQANAYIMANYLFELTGTLTIGFQEAIGVLAPQADGSGNDLLVGIYLQIGIIFYVIFQIPGFILWSFYMYDAVIWFGFDEETAVITQNYSYSILLYVMVEGINECLLGFFDVVDHEKYATIFSVIRAFIQLGSIISIAASGVTDMVAIGLAQSFIELTLMFVNIIIVVNQGWLDDYWEGFVNTIGLKDRKAMKTTFVTALPLSLAWILSNGEWQVMLIFAQSIGPDEVAAWNILGYIWDLFQALTEAIAGAAEVRVGFRMGAGKPAQAKKMAEKSIYIGILIAVLTAGGLFAIAEFLPYWLTPNPTYQILIFDQIPLIGFGEILMVPGMVIEGIFCAQGRVRLMTLIEIFVSWFIAIPLAAILVYSYDFSLGGIVSSLVIGYSIGATLLMFFFLRSDWEKLSKNVVKQSAKEGLHYLDTDWDLLPSQVQEAASTLGYTRKLWETNKEPDSVDKNWKYLTAEEKTAAAVLGYNKKKWNGETDKDGGKYEEYDFEELPTDVRQAAELLGFTHSIWNIGGDIPNEEKEWSELTEAEKNAATILGYSEDNWNDDSNSSSSDESSPTRHETKMRVIPEEKEEKYEEYDFQELPAEVKRAAKILGYTLSIWNKGGSVPNEEKEWSDLTEAEQKAATILGYTKDNWDSDSDSDSDSEMPVIPEEEKEKYDRYDFQDLPAEVMQAAKILGYTRSIWDKGKSIPNEKKDWSELTETEQIAAITLGYTQKEWDNDSDSKSSPSYGLSPWDESTQSQLQATSKSSTRPPSFKLSFTKYGEYDFDELPPEIQQAALVLGFEQEIWDRDKLIRGKIKHWDNLTSKEKEACKALGCTQTKWEKWYQGLHSTEILPTSTSSNVSQVLCCAGIETDFFESIVDR